jgi:hypothetical protein
MGAATTPERMTTMDKKRRWNRVQMKLTPEQTKKLQRLVDISEAHPMEGLIVGQGWPEYGKVVFKWVRPNELIKAVEKAEKNAKKRWTE